MEFFTTKATEEVYDRLAVVIIKFSSISVNLLTLLTLVPHLPLTLFLLLMIFLVPNLFSNQGEGK